MQKAILLAAMTVVPTPKTLLDIGCGNGSFTRALANELPYAYITALDTKVPDNPANFTGINFVQGCVEALPFQNDSFDIVTASMSLHHWARKDVGIFQAFRVLKSGGSLIIGDPLLVGWLSKPFWAKWMQKLDKGTFATPTEITTNLEAAGFVDIGISVVPNSLSSLYLITAIKP